LSDYSFLCIKIHRRKIVILVKRVLTFLGLSLIIGTVRSLRELRKKWRKKNEERLF
jgi:hypothetical protein